MHPFVNIALAAEHRADLLRAAEVRRQVSAALGRGSRSTTAPATGGFVQALTELRARLTGHRPSTVELCCAGVPTA